MVAASASGHGAVWEDREYELTVRQEPKQARMCGVGTKGVCVFLTFAFLTFLLFLVFGFGAELIFFFFFFFSGVCFIWMIVGCTMWYGLWRRWR